MSTASTWSTVAAWQNRDDSHTTTGTDTLAPYAPEQDVQRLSVQDADGSPGDRRASFAGLHRAIAENIGQVIRGKDDAIDLVLLCLIAEGHLLVEDVPGVGKTTLAHALARAFGLHFSR
ncbi:MAG: hypothetical protein JWM47_493, partial [Acidimicrobiales bacterium]|nr:hypothetical protein [Acidimicrobiales bacterium]